MPIYKKPEERASESVTIRLTLKERQLLGHLAERDEKTLTDFIRDMMFKRAEELSVTEVPEPPKKKRPGRPKKKRPVVEEIPEEIPGTPFVVIQEQRVTSAKKTQPIPVPVPTQPVAKPQKTQTGTFQELVARFRKSFAHRAEGTKREMEETIEFLTCPRETGPIIAPDLPVSALTSFKLQELRKIIQNTDLRLAKKNLHLTYLRMMLHFAVKEPDMALRVNPARDLAPLTIVETSDNWLFFSGPSK